MVHLHAARSGFVFLTCSGRITASALAALLCCNPSLAQTKPSTQVDNARAYFLHAMSTQGSDIILGSSSENGDSGMGLFDFLPNATIDRWTKDCVLLHSGVNQCNIPKGIWAGQGKAGGGKDSSAAFLRMVACGGEYNVVYPPRPTDPKAARDQEWSVRLRLKSHTMAMLGQDLGGMGGSAGRNSSAAPKEEEAQPALAPNPINLLRGLFGT